MFDRFVVMSGGHCTHPTGGPAIRLKHKKHPFVKVPVLAFASAAGCCSETATSARFPAN